LIYVVGSLHLDVIVEAPRLPRLDETLTGHAVSYRFGGKGGNQAAAAARMGARVAMAGAVGSDAFGETLLAELDRAGVNHARVVRVQGASGMSAAILDAEGNYGAVIVSGANLTVTGEGAPPQGATHLILQNEIPEPANLAAARAARAVRARVILNAAPARAMAPALLALTDILIVNRGEAEALTGLSNFGSAADALRARGPTTVIVTLGADGLLCHAEGAPGFAAPAFPARAISAHGAGDMFAGALAARLDAGEALRPALRFAQAAAALHVTTPPEKRAALRPEAVAELAGRALQSE
jgi:ribokinase